MGNLLIRINKLFKNRKNKGKAKYFDILFIDWFRKENNVSVVHANQVTKNLVISSNFVHSQIHKRSIKYL